MDGREVMDNLGSIGDILTEDLVLLKENNLLMLLNFLLGLLFLEDILHIQVLQHHS